MTDQSATLYSQIATDLAAQIRSGLLSPGTRLPSIRQLASQRDVSISTAVRSLQTLEELGLVEARPQSGYYVKPRNSKLILPSLPVFTIREQLVGRSELIWKMLKPSARRPAVSFAAGVLDSDMFPTRVLRQHLASISRRQPQLLSTYALPPGSRAFHESIVATYARWGCTLRVDEIISTAGCMEALTMCLRAVTQPGDLVAVESPTFFGLLQAFEHLHLKVVEIPSHPERGMSLETLEFVLSTMSVKAVVVSPTLTNPLGGAMSVADKRRLVDIIDHADVPLIEDDGYGDFADSATRAVPAKTFDRHGRVMLCSSFTKSLAPGFRIGWVSGGRYHTRLEMLKLTASIGSPLLLESVLAAYLASGGFERYLRKLRAKLAALRSEYADLISDTFPTGTRLSSPAGGYLFWVQLPEGINTADVLESAPDPGFCPGVTFSVSGNDFSNCLRINAGRALTPLVISAIKRLGASFHQYP